MNHVYWVRHGENRANLTLEFSSRQVDYPLTEKGRLQAEQTAKFFEGKPIDAIYSSPLKRAKETAEIIGQHIGLPVTVIEGLREINVGDLELQPPTAENWALHNRILLGWLQGEQDLRFPGGEDYHELLERVRDAYQAMLDGEDNRNIIVVSHGGILIATLQDISTKSELDPLSHLLIGNASITELEIEQKGEKLQGKLLRWADISHLSGAASELTPGYPKEDENSL